MRGSFPLALALACGMTASACSDTSEIQDPLEPPGPQLRTGNSPGGPGALVLRFESGVAVFFSGPNEQYSVIAGLSPGRLAALCAGDEVEFDPAGWQVVIRPDGSIQQVIRGDIHMLLFAGAFADYCAEAPLAAGRGRFTGNDNDVAVSLNRTNSYGFRLRGRVTEQDGSSHHVLVKFRALISRRGESRVLVEDVKVN